jgi:hypothetical protein
MKTLAGLVVFAVGYVLSAAPASAQQPSAPGPEIDHLKKMVGTWDATVKFMGGESKGTMVYKMDIGGRWLVGNFTGDFGGQKFEGRGLDSYDDMKKKYVAVWIDSMSGSPMVMEGTYDKDKKSATMTGEGPGPDGKPTKYKTVTEMKDNNTVVFTMYGPGPDGKEGQVMTITYKRKS